MGNKIIEVTLEDYLLENPTHTKDDFQKLKQISDEMFRVEALGDTRHRRRKTSIDILSNSDLSVEETPISMEARSTRNVSTVVSDARMGYTVLGLSSAG